MLSKSCCALFVNGQYRLSRKDSHHCSSPEVGDYVFLAAIRPGDKASRLDFGSRIATSKIGGRGHCRPDPSKISRGRTSSASIASCFKVSGSLPLPGSWPEARRIFVWRHVHRTAAIRGVASTTLLDDLLQGTMVPDSVLETADVSIHQTD
jgi:hypothetical protein